MSTTEPSENLPDDSASYSSEVYEQFEAYPFAEDEEFRLGLATLLGQPGAPVTEEQINREDDLVLRAKSYFYSRKQGIDPHIKPDLYKLWKEEQSSEMAEKDSVEQAEGATTTNETDDTSTQEPSYPNSFARIVELITTGQPVPGIEQIPDTVLTGHEGPSTAQPRKKPWEKDGLEQANEGNSSDPLFNAELSDAGKGKDAS